MQKIDLMRKENPSTLSQKYGYLQSTPEQQMPQALSMQRLSLLENINQGHMNSLPHKPRPILGQPPYMSRKRESLGVDYIQSLGYQGEKKDYSNALGGGKHSLSNAHMNKEADKFLRHHQIKSKILENQGYK